MKLAVTIREAKFDIELLDTPTTRALLKPFQEESWAIGIRKGNTELREKVNAFLKEFRSQGGFEELGDRYLKEQKEAFRSMGYPFYF